MILTLLLLSLWLQNTNTLKLKSKKTCPSTWLLMGWDRALHDMTPFCEQNTLNTHYQTVLLGPHSSYLEEHTTHSSKRIVLNSCLGISMQMVHSAVPISFRSWSSQECSNCSLYYLASRHAYVKTRMKNHKSHLKNLNAWVHSLQKAPLSLSIMAPFTVVWECLTI